MNRIIILHAMSGVIVFDTMGTYLVGWQKAPNAKLPIKNSQSLKNNETLLLPNITS
jgi:hypothetical protein